MLRFIYFFLFIAGILSSLFLTSILFQLIGYFFLSVSLYRIVDLPYEKERRNETNGSCEDKESKRYEEHIAKEEQRADEQGDL